MGTSCQDGLTNCKAKAKYTAVIAAKCGSDALTGARVSMRCAATVCTTAAHETTCYTAKAQCIALMTAECDSDVWIVTYTSKEYVASM